MFPNINPIPTFPKYRGPLNVGTSEFEIPVSQLHSSSKVPDPEISTIKFRAFYPAQITTEKVLAVNWLPEPQREWLDAYGAFLNAPPKLSKLFSYAPLPLKYTTIPAKQSASSFHRRTSGQWPVLVFSHGLGGSCNTYSHLLGSLASCGVVCVAPEHRDQSAPVSIIREIDGSRKSVKYRKLSHDPNTEVLAGRNAQLRVRLWELELLYTALEALNHGKVPTNLANDNTPSFKDKLDLRPSKVGWGGHSFGAATMVQFVKSVFWQQSLPNGKGDTRSKPIFDPLYTPAENAALKDQITADSPIVLLDLWTMPLHGEETYWLWEKPLPCYAVDGPPKNNVLAIMSEQFYKWTTLLDRTKAVLSRKPAEQETSKNFSKYSPSSSSSSNGPRLFYAPKTAHLSQSDVALLFPWAAKKWLNAEEPERTLLLNTRAILQLLRENQISVESIKLGETTDVEEPALDDPSILAEHGNIQGWVSLSIA